MKRDKYSEILNNFIENVEEIYGLNDDVVIDNQDTSQSLGSLEIVELVSVLTDSISSMEVTQLMVLNKQTDVPCIYLPYIEVRLTYNSYYKLNYSNFPCMEEVCNVLLAFTNKDKVNKSSISEANSIVTVLDTMERTDISIVGELSYKMLRIFIVMVLHNNYLGACIVSKFILNQLLVKGE